MDEKSLRALVREEIERALNEEMIIDDHRKFRRLVEAKIGRRFTDDSDGWDTTFTSWSSAVQEAGSNKVEADILDYYVNDAMKVLSEGLHHMQAFTLQELEKMVPEAVVALADAPADLTYFYVLEAVDENDPSIVVDGVPWALMATEGEPSEEEDMPPWQWVPADGAWVDTTRY